ncbi:MAG: hypothetical protein HY287_05100 [Planctomycetes bacterium]|nr:hypothetical protein [Planctomycetota bacterium]MBI3833691.1 hypothetical protein [Planctomycetota bacterium]
MSIAPDSGYAFLNRHNRQNVIRQTDRQVLTCRAARKMGFLTLMTFVTLLMAIPKVAL